MDQVVAERIALALERIADALEEPVAVQPPVCLHVSREPRPDSTFGAELYQCADCKEPL